MPEVPRFDGDALEESVEKAIHENVAGYDECQFRTVGRRYASSLDGKDLIVSLIEQVFPSGGSRLIEIATEV